MVSESYSIWNEKVLNVLGVFTFSGHIIFGQLIITPYSKWACVKKNKLNLT